MNSNFTIQIEHRDLIKCAVVVDGKLQMSELKKKAISRINQLIIALDIPEIKQVSTDIQQIYFMNGDGVIYFDQDQINAVLTNNQILLLCDKTQLQESFSINSSTSQYKKTNSIRISDVISDIPSQQNIMINNQQSQQKIQDLKELFYLNVSQWNQQQFQANNYNFSISIRFLQAQNQQKEYQLKCQLSDSLQDLSNQICQYLQIQDNLYTVIFYNLNGMPLFQNISNMSTLKVEKIFGELFDRVFFVIVTKCQIGGQSMSKLDSNKGPDQIFIQQQQSSTIFIDLKINSVIQLKQKIYHKLSLPTNIQILKFNGVTLEDQKELKHYGILNKSNIILTLKNNISIGYSENYNDIFYMPWMKHMIEQSDQGIRQFRCSTLVLFAHYPNNQAIHTIRQYSNNNTSLTLAVANLIQMKNINQLHRIALEEGFMRLYFDLIMDNTILPQNFRLNSIFEYSRRLNLFLLNQFNKFDQISQIELFLNIEKECQISLQNIENPVFLKCDQFETNILQFQIVDEEQFKALQKTQQQLQNGKKFSECFIQKDKQLTDQFKIMRNLNHSSLAWFDYNKYKAANNKEKLENNWFLQKDEQMFKKLKIGKSENQPFLIYNNLGLLNVCVGFRKGDNDDNLIFFDPIDGQETIGNKKKEKEIKKIIIEENVVEVQDDNKITIESVITIIPEEAIIVLFDISASMDAQFYNNQDLSRIGAVKAFFNAFADRTIAYKLKHVISLIFFDSRYIVKCGFTENFRDFKTLIDKAKPAGLTSLYNSIKKAIDSLIELQKIYPQCILRIIALTDGEDTSGGSTPEQLGQLIIENKIILDSFVVAKNCNQLKMLTKAVGGQCFCPESVKQGIKLFEYETLVSAKIRLIPQAHTTKQELINFLAQNPETIPFDTQPRQFKLPNELNARPAETKKLVRQITSENNISIASSTQQIRRIMKELMVYEQNPHQFFKIFPCANNLTFWKILLIGPSVTPYSKGLFVLYMVFPQDYPVKPPEIRFVTKIYHCNINSQGRICHSILDRNYTIDTKIINIFSSIFGLLLTPEPDDPLDSTIAAEYLGQLDIYQQKAIEFTTQYTKNNMEEVIKLILGDTPTNTNEYQERSKEITQWYTLTVLNDK